MTIHIKNKGVEAYRHEEYGDEIVVERSIHRTGNASGYKIQSTIGSRKNRRTVSTKRDELDKILDHMNIQVRAQLAYMLPKPTRSDAPFSVSPQVDNPINVLSQDSARAFLAKSGPRDKYDVSMRA